MKNKSKIRFLLLTSYAPPEHAGSGINALHFAQHLNETRSIAKILSFNRNLKFKGVDFIHHTKIIRIPYLNKNFIFKLLSSPLILAFYIINIIKNRVVFIYGNKIILYEFVILFSLLLRKKIVFRSLLNGIDDIESILADNKGLIWFHKFLFEKIDVYYSINKEFSASYMKYIAHPEKILEQPQGIDAKIYYPVDKSEKDALRQSLNIPDGIVIISTGFLIDRKGYREIFNALAALKFSFHYIILGDYLFDKDHFLSKFSTEAIELFNYGKSVLGEKLIFTGHVLNVNEYLQCADIYIHGSKQEGLPNALLEAMAVGLPVITNNIPGLAHLILQENLNCLVFNNEEEIISSITRVANNKQLAEKLGENAARFINESCSFEVVTSCLIKKLYPEDEA